MKVVVRILEMNLRTCASIYQFSDKSCYMCPKITRIFPPTSSRQSSNSNTSSDISLQRRNGYVKINYKLVRQCLIHGLPNEKCEVLNAILLVSLVVKFYRNNVAVNFF